MEDILSLPVQDPPCAEFSAAQIKWVKVEGGRQGGDDIALIPFARVDDFVKGESSNAECPASFRIESRRKRPEGSISKPRVDGYLEYTLYVIHVNFNPLGADWMVFSNFSSSFNPKKSIKTMLTIVMFCVTFFSKKFLKTLKCLVIGIYFPVNLSC